MLTVTIERTVDNRSPRDRIAQLEAQKAVLEARIRVLEQQLGERLKGESASPGVVISPGGIRQIR